MNTSFNTGEASSKGWFELQVDGEIVARMTYSRVDPHYVIIDHTAVDPSFKGKGYGKAIVQRMVEWARNNAQSVLPLCTFAKKVIEDTPEFHDILKR